MHPRFVVILLVLASAAIHAAEVEFVGYFRVGTEARFVVARPEKGTTSDWLAVGERFQEFTIKAFDEKNESLQVSGPGGTVTLRLKPSRVLPAIPASIRTPLYVDVTSDGVIAVGNESTNLASLKKFLAAAVAADPDVAIIVRASVEGDAAWLQSLFRRIREDARSLGVRGIGLISQPPNKAPEPTP
jgi:biopolymer transport protein ExbD